MSNPSFNLIDQPFIPCVTLAGQHAEFSLLETLTRAHEIRELRDESPLVTIALHRLLLAILHRNFGPDGYDAWKALWDAGRFEADTLTAYFEQWRDRFDLFDEQHPFYQTADLTTDKPDAAARLVRHISQTYTDTLFNHTIQHSFPAFNFAEGARHLILEQSLAVQGGRGFVSSHATDAIVFLVSGRSLFETLTLNLVWYDGDERPIPSRNDRPSWESDSFRESHRSPRGFIEALTWQPRRIRLIPADDCIREMIYSKGPRCEHVATQPDPMLAYRVSKQSGVVPYSFSPERLLWRDSAVLFAASEADDSKEFFRPEILNHLMTLSGPARGCLDPNTELDLRAFGVVAKKAAIKFWREESLPLRLAYLSDADRVADLQNALNHAEFAGRALFGCTKTLATQLLAPDGRKPDATRVTSIAKSLAPDRPYWSRLEQPFRRLLHDLVHGPDDGQLLVARWACQTVRPAAIRAFEETTEQLDHSARTLRAVARATAQLRAQLHKEFEDQKEQIHGEEESRVATSVAD